MQTLQIHFDGDWTPDEKHVLVRAIEDAEALRRPAPSKRRAGGPWICYCKRLRGTSVYMAHRSGWSLVLHAYGASALGTKILLFGQQTPDPGAWSNP